MPSSTRRRALALLGATGAVGLGGCLAEFSDRSPNGDLGDVGGRWPMVGQAGEQTRRVDTGPADPEPIWTVDLEGARTAGTPSIADGRVYVPIDAVSDRARHRHRLHALDAGTGEERWRVPFRADLNASPALLGGRVVVSAQRDLEKGRLVAVDDTYGEEAWLYDVDARVTAPPTSDGIRVYLPDWEGTVHAITVGDGSVRWARRIGSDEKGRTFANPIAIRDDALYLGSSGGATGVVAVDARTGDVRWARSTARVIAGPVVDDGLVAVRDENGLAAFDTEGTERWTVAVPDDGHGSPLALDDDRVYVPTRDALRAIDRSGEAAWTYEYEGGGPPTVVGDAVLLAEGETLTALSATDGTIRWRVDIDGSGEVIATRNAFVTSGSGGRVTALGET